MAKEKGAASEEGTTKTKSTRRMPDTGIEVVSEIPTAPARGRAKVYDNLLRTVAHEYPGTTVKIATFHSAEGAAQARRSFYTKNPKDRKEVPGGNTDDWAFEARKGSGPVDTGGNGIAVGDSCLYVTFNGDPSTVPVADSTED